MAIPPDFMKQFMAEQAEVTQATVLDISALAGLTSAEFMKSMSELLDLIGRMAVKELADVIVDTPNDADKIRDLITLTYRCGAGSELLNKMTAHEDLIDLLTPSDSMVQHIYDIIRKIVARKRKDK